MRKNTKSYLKKLAIKERNKKDKEWSKSIRSTFGNQCAYCGSKVRTNAAHIIPREIPEFRHDSDNGIALCPKHHKFSFQFSAHHNPFAFMLWFSNAHPLQFAKMTYKWEDYINQKVLSGQSLG